MNARAQVGSFLVICGATACFPNLTYSDPAAARDATDSDGNTGAASAVPDGAGGDAGASAPPARDLDGSVGIDGGAFAFALFGSNSVVGRLSYSFAIGTYEATVGDFRRWEDAGRPTPFGGAACTGTACSLDPGGAYEAEMQWLRSWDRKVDPSSIPPCSPCQYNEANVDTHDAGVDRPINCVTWYEAVAVCWFLGHRRLPTDIEMLAATRGLTDDRPFSWGGSPDDEVSCEQAIWAKRDAATPYCGFPTAVGTATGRSPEGAFDLNGSVAEWLWDRGHAWPDKRVDVGGDYVFSVSVDGGSDDEHMSVPPAYCVDTARNGAAQGLRNVPWSAVGFRCAATTRR